MSTPLQHATNEDRRIRDELLRMWPSLADDDRALADTLDGESDFKEAARHVLRSALYDDALAAGLDKLLGECTERKLRLEERAQIKKAALLSAMQAAQRTKLELPEATLTVRNNPRRVVVTNEDDIPDRYWKTQEPTLDKRALGDDLKNGSDVTGATLDNGSVSLQIRKG